MVPSLIVVLLANTGEAEGKQVVPGIVKSATGEAAMVIVFVIAILLQPLAVFTINVMVYVPAAAYVYDGFCNVDVPSIGPSPKRQFQPFTTPPFPLEVSVKLMVLVVQFKLNENPAVGNGFTLMV